MQPEASAIIHVVDGYAMSSSLPPRTSKTFGEYVAGEVIPKTHHVCFTYMRTDIVFDVYCHDSLKSETRRKRVQAARRRVTEKSMKFP